MRTNKQMVDLYIQTGINKCKIKIGNRGQEKELTGISPLRR
jgi:hypothetical protein